MEKVNLDVDLLQKLNQFMSLCTANIKAVRNGVSCKRGNLVVVSKSLELQICRKMLFLVKLLQRRQDRR